MDVKLSLDKLELVQPFNKFIPSQPHQSSITQLDIKFRHVNEIAKLPFYHRDPFDRIIISQAIVEDVPIISNDRHFDLYEIERIW